MPPGAPPPACLPAPDRLLVSRRRDRAAPRQPGGGFAEPPGYDLRPAVV
ncbi:hypothetical protein FRAHR75_100116 [Frankia sp. Hr75.2]|nr:hypothetical protein FRAHR75_100116 [Frankia sp. Hr75.2]SQD94335.1 hypothetical protein FMEAI12_2480004 [Parafrankia sp. Ea1.12]